jgi:hypothetical protein
MEEATPNFGVLLRCIERDGRLLPQYWQGGRILHEKHQTHTERPKRKAKERRMRKEEERERERERGRERAKYTSTRGRDICCASAMVVAVSGSSLHLSAASHSADANTSPTDVLPCGEGFKRPTMISTAPVLKRERERDKKRSGK